jgi:hypothetical protein
MPKPHESEKGVLDACLQLLSMKGIFHYRNNTGALYDRNNRLIRFGAVGSPDIVAIICGQYVGIECKSTIGKQSDNQRLFQIGVEKAGGVYIIVRSVEDLLQALKQLYVAKR